MLSPNSLVLILQRVSGLILWIAIAPAIYLLDHVLVDIASYTKILEQVQTPLGKITLAILFWALLHYLLSEFRLLLIDCGMGLETTTLRQSAWFVIFLSPIIAIILLV